MVSLLKYSRKADIDQHNKCKQHKADGKKHLPVKARGVSHFGHNSSGKETNGIKGQRNINRASRYEADRHGLSDGTADSQDDSCDDARLCSRKNHLKNRLDLSGPQRQGCAS